MVPSAERPSPLSRPPVRGGASAGRRRALGLLLSFPLLAAAPARARAMPAGVAAVWVPAVETARAALPIPAPAAPALRPLRLGGGGAVRLARVSVRFGPLPVPEAGVPSPKGVPERLLLRSRVLTAVGAPMMGVGAGVLAAGAASAARVAPQWADGAGGTTSAGPAIASTGAAFAGIGLGVALVATGAALLGEARGARLRAAEAGAMRAGVPEGPVFAGLGVAVRHRRLGSGLVAFPF